MYCKALKTLRSKCDSSNCKICNKNCEGIFCVSHRNCAVSTSVFPDAGLRIIALGDADSVPAVRETQGSSHVAVSACRNEEKLRTVNGVARTISSECSTSPLLRFLKEHCFLKVPRLIPLVLLVKRACGWSMRHWCNDIGGGQPKYLDKYLSQCHLTTTNLT